MAAGEQRRPATDLLPVRSSATGRCKPLAAGGLILQTACQSNRGHVVAARRAGGTPVAPCGAGRSP